MMLRRLKYLVQDPPPLLVVEISEQAVAAVRRSPRTYQAEAGAYRELDPGVVQPSLGKQNVQRPEKLEAALGGVLEELGPVRRPDAALILPDASSRLTVLEFDQLPGDARERVSLIRWRLKKTVPFDIAFSNIAYQPQPSANGFSLLVAVTPPEVLRQYEAPLQKAGLWPGFVSLSTALALNLVPDGDMTLFVKLAGRSLTMAALEAGAVRMIRNVDLAPDTDLARPEALKDMVGDLYPTFVFIADNLGSEVSRLILCGFGDLLQPALQLLPAELGCQVQPLRGPNGVVEAREAGIWGYLSVQ